MKPRIYSECIAIGQRITVQGSSSIIHDISRVFILSTIVLCLKYEKQMSLDIRYSNGTIQKHYFISYKFLLKYSFKLL